MRRLRPSSPFFAGFWGRGSGNFPFNFHMLSSLFGLLRPFFIESRRETKIMEKKAFFSLWGNNGGEKGAEGRSEALCV
jgi:hypothetical protein